MQVLQPPLTLCLLPFVCNVYHDCTPIYISIERKAVVVQYYGDEWDVRHDEDVRDGVWLFDGTEEAFFSEYPQFKDTSKKNKAIKLTYNEMVIEALYAINSKDGNNIQSIRRYIETTYSSISQKASFNR